MKCLSVFLFAFILLSSLLVPHAQAATISAANCSQSAVQAAVDSVSPGDAVLIPSGSCTWNSPVTISNGITVQGAGESSTIITSAGSAIFVINGKGSGNYRITNMKFLGGIAGGTDILINKAWDTMRIDHITWDTDSTRAFWIGQHIASDIIYYSGLYRPHEKVLIDHITYYGTETAGNPFALIYGRGYKAWQEDGGWGTDNFVYIEDSTFTYPEGDFGYITDTQMAGRFVVRHCTIQNAGIYMHDCCGFLGDRGNRAAEVYDNVMTCIGTDCANHIALNNPRGGPALFYSNNITGYSDWGTLWPMIFRVAYADTFMGSNTGCAYTGTLKVCQDMAKRCSISKKPCYSQSDCELGDGNCPTQSVVTCTSNADCLDMDGNQLLCMQMDGLGRTGGEPTGYPCRDQNGRGKEDPLTGAQALQPVYWWNNTIDGISNKSMNGGSVASYFAENRDFCNHSPATSCGAKGAWTYTAYTYPHPLQSGTSPPTQTCGNNQKEGTEICDGTDLAGQTCISQGFTGGTLACNSQCTAFVTTGCSAALTCASQGFYCCASGYTCSQTRTGTGCSGTCCASQSACSPPSQYFLPEQYVQAESGTLNGMQTGVSGSDTYIYTSTDYSGSASYTFQIDSPGKYVMQARVNNNNDGGENSFYVGLDSEAAQNNTYYTYNLFPLQTGFFWDNVSRWGNGISGDIPISEFDPMVWELTEGLHTFSFYGRESNTWLDQIILRRACIHRSDSNCDGCVSDPELFAFIGLWYVDSSNPTLRELIEAIGLWKRGC